jgi:integrase
MFWSAVSVQVVGHAQPAVAASRKVDEFFPSITAHEFRRTAVCLAVSACANVKAVQRMLGHAKASMTLRIADCSTKTSTA